MILWYENLKKIQILIFLYDTKPQKKTHLKSPTDKKVPFSNSFFHDLIHCIKKQNIPQDAT